MHSLYRLLIVDDETTIRNGMEKFLPWGRLGYEVIGTAENGLEARSWIERKSVDVICCDIRMPYMDGLELAKFLWETTSPTKIVLYTGYRDFDYARQAIQYGVRYYILKTAKLSEVIDAFTVLKTELDSTVERRPEIPDEAEVIQGPLADRLVAAMRRFVEDNLAEDCSLKAISSALGKSMDYLGRVFKQRTGENFSDFVLRTKMARAVEYLSDFHYQSQDVARMVGYTNPKNFSRAFRTYTGQAPREFRNTGGLDPQAEHGPS